MPIIHAKTALTIGLSTTLAAIALAATACSSDDDVEAPPSTLGGITIASRERAAGQDWYYVSGWFRNGTQDSGCTSHREGNCTISTCAPSAADAGVATLDSAGTLTVSGGLLPAPGITLEPRDDKSYFRQGLSKIWEPGQRIAIKSSGAQIPAFELSVTAPSNLVLEVPAVPHDDAPMVIPRGTPLELRWSAVPDKKSVAFYSPVDIPPGAPSIGASCEFEPSSTTATLPTSVLGLFPKGEAIFEVVTRNEATTLIAGKTVKFHARTYAKGTSGTSVSRNVTLE
ncbi:hypothetical protein LVJ94_16985 [Pendulispora rubella]|uniref:Lipoprotein n=1 Tax=Pendulispora rubella TaxID=2741070 RepID=A0ABZ2LDA4_9BACT